ncbi:MAG: hypothetical protein R3E97_15495 [Candidatus Eisenbacteria bacterium]
MIDQHTHRARVLPGVALAGLVALLVVGCQSEPEGTSDFRDSTGAKVTATEQHSGPGAPGSSGTAADVPAGRMADAAQNPDGAPGAGTAASGNVAESSRPATPEALAGEGLSPLPVRPMPESQYVDFSSVPAARMGEEPGKSRFAGQEGFEAADDPERDSVIRGRREAPEVQGDLDGGVRGFDKLIGEIMTALDNQDARAFTYLRISGHDYQKFCWPEFPESRPVTNIPVNESWFFLERRCQGGINSGINRFGDLGYYPVRIEFKEGRADYRNFRFWKGMVIHAKRAGSDEEVAIDFAEVVIERNGLFKVYAFED